MDFIINLLVSAGVLFLLAYIMPQVHVKSFLTALWVAFLIGLFNATIGLILGFIFNLFTLFLLSFIIRLIVLAIMIKLVDKLVGNFKVDGFWPALVIAAAMAFAGTFLERENAEDREMSKLELNKPKVEQVYVQK